MIDALGTLTIEVRRWRHHLQHGRQARRVTEITRRALFFSSLPSLRLDGFLNRFARVLRGFHGAFAIVFAAVVDVFAKVFA